MHRSQLPFSNPFLNKQHGMVSCGCLGFLKKHSWDLNKAPAWGSAGEHTQDILVSTPLLLWHIQQLQLVWGWSILPFLHQCFDISSGAEMPPVPSSLGNKQDNFTGAAMENKAKGILAPFVEGWAAHLSSNLYLFCWSTASTLNVASWAAAESQLSTIYIVNSLKPVLYPLRKSRQSCLLADNNIRGLAAAIADNINYLVFCQFLLDFSG